MSTRCTSGSPQIEHPELHIKEELDDQQQLNYDDYPMEDIKHQLCDGIDSHPPVPNESMLAEGNAMLVGDYQITEVKQEPSLSSDEDELPESDDDPKDDDYEPTAGSSNCSTQQLSCELCGKQLVESSMQRHMQTYHAIPGSYIMREGKMIFKCTFCELEFFKRKQMLQHCDQWHPEQLKEIQKESAENQKSLAAKHPTKCTVCKAEVASMQEYISHLDSDHAEMYCYICYKVFRDPVTLMLHQRVHFGGNPFACDLCPKVFTSIYAVSDHRIGHTGEKPVKCDQCSQTFARKGELTKHIKHRHTKEPSYFCPECPAKFYSATTFQNHKRKHRIAREGDGLKATIPCDLCSKMFKRKSEKKHHIQVDHPEGRPFGCPHCPKRFTVRTSLTTHLRIHSAVKAFQCDQCPSAFHQAGDLRRHKGKLHKDIASTHVGHLI